MKNNTEYWYRVWYLQFITPTLVPLVQEFPIGMRDEGPKSPKYSALVIYYLPGIPDLPGSYSYSSRDIPDSRYKNKSARYIASARYVIARYITSALYWGIPRENPGEFWNENILVPEDGEVKKLWLY